MKKEKVELITLALDVARIGSWEVDVRKAECFWSDITYQIHEVPLGTKIKLEEGINYYVEEHRPIIQACVDNAIESGEPWDVELKIKTAKNNIRWVRAIGRVVIENNELVKLEGVFQDIHDKKTQQIELDNLLQRYNLAMSISNMGIWDWNIPKNILEWDDKMFEVYGMSKKNFSSAYEAWSAGLHPEDREQSEAGVQEALAGKKVFNQDFRVITELGEIKYVGTLSTVIRDEDGNPLRMLGMNWDKTQEVRDKENLEKLNEELVQFSYRTSHDLKSPLNSIKSIVNIALQSLEEKDYDLLEKDLNTIDRQIDRLTRLIQDIMELTKIDNLESNLEKVDLKTEIENFIKSEKIFFEQENVAFYSDIKHKGNFFSDRMRVIHILSNLINNSVKYSDSNKDSKYVKVQTYNEANFLIIKIEDNGVGIPKEYHPEVFKMFKRFNQTKEGTGLGLYMIKKNIESINGEISFESSPEKTIFTIKLPLGKEGVSIG